MVKNYEALQCLARKEIEHILENITKLPKLEVAVYTESGQQWLFERAMAANVNVPTVPVLSLVEEFTLHLYQPNSWLTRHVVFKTEKGEGSKVEEFGSFQPKFLLKESVGVYLFKPQELKECCELALQVKDFVDDLGDVILECKR